MKITVRSEETRPFMQSVQVFLKISCSSELPEWSGEFNFCVAEVFYPLVTDVESKLLLNACESLKLNIWYIVVHACVRSYLTVHFYMYKRKQLKHCYDDRAKILLHRIQVLTFNTINFVVKNH